jgi:hypothetical protein
MKPLPIFSLLLLYPTVEAATLTAVSSDATELSSVDMTTEGTLNWAIWNSRSNPDSSPGADYFMNSGTTGTISEISRTTGSGVRGTDSVTSYPQNIFTWSNGNSNTVPERVTGMFTTTDQTTIGVQFSITNLPSLTNGEVYLINLYGSAFRGTAEVSAVSGTLLAKVTGLAKTESKKVERYQFHYNPDSTEDVLTLQSLLKIDDGSNAHALINGVSISIVPEPSPMILGGMGMLSLMAVRRRK